MSITLTWYCCWYKTYHKKWVAKCFTQCFITCVTSNHGYTYCKWYCMKDGRVLLCKVFRMHYFITNTTLKSTLRKNSYKYRLVITWHFELQIKFWLKTLVRNLWLLAEFTTKDSPLKFPLLGNKLNSWCFTTVRNSLFFGYATHGYT